jgi:hypothetical protein
MRSRKVKIRHKSLEFRIVVEKISISRFIFDFEYLLATTASGLHNTEKEYCTISACRWSDTMRFTNIASLPNIGIVLNKSVLFPSLSLT